MPWPPIFSVTSKPSAVQFLGEPGGGFLLLVGQFRMRVQVLVQRVEALDLGVDFFLDLGLASWQVVGDILADLSVDDAGRQKHHRHDRQRSHCW